MPVARGHGIDPRNALVVGATAVVLALVIGGMILYLVSRDDIEVRLGDDRFEDINAESAADEIARRGPILFQDPVGGSRDIFLQHLGDDHEQGWYAFDVRPPGEPRECQVVWQPDAEEFVDNGRCSEPITVPADGTGLPQYPAVVNDKGRVVIDLNAAARGETDTSITTTQAP